MQTRLAAFVSDTPDGREAADILRKCVHCGFCTATCPTYRLIGDELDGPRGRIYLVKQVLEGATPTPRTQLHLDRCLTCRACETTCPSGVEYGRLADIGRRLIDERVPRPLTARAMRAALRAALTGRLFSPALAIGRVMRPLLPRALREKVPLRRRAGAWPKRRHSRKVLLLAGCVQPAMSPRINAATARVLDALGIETMVPRAAGCCGAIRQHLGDPDGALANARRNVDAWWPHLESGAEAIVMNASGCGVQVKEYPHLLRQDPAYAAKAHRIGALTRDLAEILPAGLPALAARLRGSPRQRLAFHPPCTLQHGQQIRGVVEELLAACGADVQPFTDAHLCCGSAGTYSLLQPAIARELRDRKLAAIAASRPELIVSANIGCIAHLAGAAGVPVLHWIEWIDDRLAACTTTA